MLPFLQGGFGNPSSTHEYGRRTHAAVDKARRQVAALLGAEPGEIVFTGGGSEASNHAIKGTILPLLHARRPATIVTTTIEHPATLEPCAYLERLGATIRRVGVDRFGRVDMDAMAAALDGATLVSVMHSNNEVGTLQPIREIAALARARGVLVHTDAAQSLGKVPVDVNDLGVDLLTLAGHKLYAPKGMGVPTFATVSGWNRSFTERATKRVAGRGQKTCRTSSASAWRARSRKRIWPGRPTGSGNCAIGYGIGSTASSANGSSSTAIRSCGCRTR
jgi:cysteine sulfinate desulfinase/cysteine desulfurase-like protein